jgi:hypothetical protein
MSGPGAGRIFTVAGNGNGTFSPAIDGANAAEAGLVNIWDVYVESSGDVLIAENGIRSYYMNPLIYRVSASDGRIHVIAGNASASYDPLYIADGTPALKPFLESALAVCTAAPSGTVYFADFWNVMYISKAGLLYVLGGRGTVTIDGGPASDSFFSGVYALRPGATDADLLVTSVNDATVYRIDLYSRRVYVEAGVRLSNAISPQSSDGARATLTPFVSPNDAIYDAISGDVFVSDFGGNTIVRIFASNATVQVVAGNGLRGAVSNDFISDATEVPLNNPYGIVLDGHGGLIFADTNNCLIHRVDFAVSNKRHPQYSVSVCCCSTYRFMHCRPG